MGEGFPDISNAAMNSSKQWNHRLAQDLGLEAEGQKYPAETTNFQITITLQWQAKMYDTVDGVWEVQTGNLITLFANCYWKSGIKTKPSMG